jgi:2-polyprenyl-3-methyl-5-hydroxy-6-metoxy-1,4-benzoquinol methylase
MLTAAATDLERRARQSRGRSHAVIYDLVVSLLAARRASGTLVDVGCGTGCLWRALQRRFTRCVGIDAIRYDELPADVEFRRADLDRDPLPLEDAGVDAAVAVEVIEHLENPRAFVRELTRVVRPGGWIVITTPNQLSLLSLITLAAKGRFSAFQDNAYPAHRTALLEIDLRRIASECGLEAVDVRYTAHGRLPFTSRHVPQGIAHAAPRWWSDNLAMIARRPAPR